MAMNVGERHEGAMADMNVVPLIDVLLVLLIIFMVIAPIAPAGLHAAIPQPPAPTSAGDTTAVVVEITAQGTVTVNQQSVSWDGLAAQLDSIFERRAEKVAFVQGESGTQFADVARALDVMHASGINEVGLLSSKQAAQKSN